MCYFALVVTALLFLAPPTSADVTISPDVLRASYPTFVVSRDMCDGGALSVKDIPIGMTITFDQVWASSVHVTADRYSSDTALTLVTFNGSDPRTRPHITIGHLGWSHYFRILNATIGDLTSLGRINNIDLHSVSAAEVRLAASQRTFINASDITASYFSVPMCKRALIRRAHISAVTAISHAVFLVKARDLLLVIDSSVRKVLTAPREFVDSRAAEVRVFTEATLRNVSIESLDLHPLKNTAASRVALKASIDRRADLTIDGSSLVFSHPGPVDEISRSVEDPAAALLLHAWGIDNTVVIRNSTLLPTPDDGNPSRLRAASVVLTTGVPAIEFRGCTLASPPVRLKATASPDVCVASSVFSHGGSVCATAMPLRDCASGVPISVCRPASRWDTALVAFGLSLATSLAVLGVAVSGWPHNAHRKVESRPPANPAFWVALLWTIFELAEVLLLQIYVVALVTGLVADIPRFTDVFFVTFALVPALCALTMRASRVVGSPRVFGWNMAFPARALFVVAPAIVASVLSKRRFDEHAVAVAKMPCAAPGPRTWESGLPQWTFLLPRRNLTTLADVLLSAALMACLAACLWTEPAGAHLYKIAFAAAIALPAVEVSRCVARVPSIALIAVATIVFDALSMVFFLGSVLTPSASGSAGDPLGDPYVPRYFSVAWTSLIVLLAVVLAACLYHPLFTALVPFAPMRTMALINMCGVMHSWHHAAGVSAAVAAAPPRRARAALRSLVVCAPDITSDSDRDETALPTDADGEAIATFYSVSDVRWGTLQQSLERLLPPGVPAVFLGLSFAVPCIAVADTLLTNAQRPVSSLCLSAALCLAQSLFVASLVFSARGLRPLLAVVAAVGSDRLQAALDKTDGSTSANWEQLAATAVAFASFDHPRRVLRSGVPHCVVPGRVLTRVVVPFAPLFDVGVVSPSTPDVSALPSLSSSFSAPGSRRELLETETGTEMAPVSY